MEHQKLFEEILNRKPGRKTRKEAEAERDLIDLMLGNSEALITRLYNEVNSRMPGRRGRIRKFPFFIYWLILKTGSTKWENIDAILENIWEKEPQLIPARDPDGFRFRYSKKIRSRYKNRQYITEALAKLAIEQTPFSSDYLNLLKNLELHLISQPPPEDFEAVFLSLLNVAKERPEFIKILESVNATSSGSEIVKKISGRLQEFIREKKFKIKLLRYLGQSKEVSLRELQIKFSKKKSYLLFFFLNYPALNNSLNKKGRRSVSLSGLSRINEKPILSRRLNGYSFIRTLSAGKKVSR